MKIINILTILADEDVFEWNWCLQPGVQDVFNVIRGVLSVLRIVVPIGLVAMTVVDIAKKVINPEDKDGQKKIMNRAIAALIVFLIPTFIKFTFRVIDWGLGNNGQSTYDSATGGLSACWDGKNQAVSKSSSSEKTSQKKSFANDLQFDCSYGSLIIMDGNTRLSWNDYCNVKYEDHSNYGVSIYSCTGKDPYDNSTKIKRCSS